MGRLTLSILGLIFVVQCGREPQPAPSLPQSTPQTTTQSCDYSSYKPLRGGVQSPAISLPQPVYPAEAKAQKLHGQVIVKVLVNLHTGIVEKACVASGDEVLGRAATEAALKSRYAPDWGNNRYLAERYNYIETQISYNFVAP